MMVLNDKRCASWNMCFESNTNVLGQQKVIKIVELVYLPCSFSAY